jgi:simple sugar transport system permease protein
MIGRTAGRLGPVAAAVVALAVTLAASAVALVLGGYDPAAAYGALLRGAVGSPSQFLSISLVRATPLILTGLAVALAFRSGIWNIGAEGQLYAGAIAGAWVGIHGSGLPPAVVLPAVALAAGVAGCLWALIPTLLKVRMGVGEVITTLLMNFVGIHLAAYTVHGPMQEARGVFPQTDLIAEAARLPRLIPGTRLHAGFILALGLALLIWLVMRFSVYGFQVRAVGASPAAAAVAGRIRTRRVVVVTFLLSGALAGIGGGVEVSGVTYALYENFSPGYGYTAIAVALLAGLHPLGVVATGIFFGALEGGAGAMQREAGIPAVWVNVIEALVILAVLAVDRAVRRLQVGRKPDGDADSPEPARARGARTLSLEGT